MYLQNLFFYYIGIRERSRSCSTNTTHTFGCIEALATTNGCTAAAGGNDDVYQNCVDLTSHFDLVADGSVQTDKAGPAEATQLPDCGEFFFA